MGFVGISFAGEIEYDKYLAIKSDLKTNTDIISFDEFIGPAINFSDFDFSTVDASKAFIRRDFVPYKCLIRCFVAYKNKYHDSLPCLRSFRFTMKNVHDLNFAHMDHDFHLEIFYLKNFWLIGLLIRYQ